MGAIDMIFDADDLPVWLELNTQGQFLFVEALSGYDLTGRFADFLQQTATQKEFHGQPAASET